MKEILKSIGARVREWGYRGSGQNYRSTLDDVVFVINIQKSRWGDQFYVNLGAQPLVIPHEGEGEPDPKALKEYECVFRSRVKNEWRTDLSPPEVEDLLRLIDETRKAFQAKVLEMRDLSRRGLGRELLESHGYILSGPRAGLILGRLLAADGHAKAARFLAQQAIASAGRADMLRAAAERLIAGLPEP